jgi:hypothetical protein
MPGYWRVTRGACQADAAREISCAGKTTEISRMYSPNSLLGRAWVHGDALVLIKAEASAPR